MTAEQAPSLALSSGVRKTDPTHRVPRREVVAATVTGVKDLELNVDSYHRWAAGNLVDNRNRGIFAEWLVGQALGAIEDRSSRVEWDAWDLDYQGAGIEVKASGLSQSWNRCEASKRPTFGIAVPKSVWHAETDSWYPNDKGTRPADVYVFCLHVPVPANNENVADPKKWKYWVISAQTLDEKLGTQQTVGTSTLDSLTDPIRWTGIKPAVDALIPRVRG